MWGWSKPAGTEKDTGTSKGENMQTKDQHREQTERAGQQRHMERMGEVAHNRGRAQAEQGKRAQHKPSTGSSKGGADKTQAAHRQGQGEGQTESQQRRIEQDKRQGHTQEGQGRAGAHSKGKAASTQEPASRTRREGTSQQGSKGVAQGGRQETTVHKGLRRQGSRQNQRAEGGYIRKQPHRKGIKRREWQGRSTNSTRNNRATHKGCTATSRNQSSRHTTLRRQRAAEKGEGSGTETNRGRAAQKQNMQFKTGRKKKEREETSRSAKAQQRRTAADSRRDSSRGHRDRSRRQRNTEGRKGAAGAQ